MSSPTSDNTITAHQSFPSQESQILALKQWSMYVASVLSCIQSKAEENLQREIDCSTSCPMIKPSKDQKSSQEINLHCEWVEKETRIKQDGALGDDTTITLQNSCDFCHYHSSNNKKIDGNSNNILQEAVAKEEEEEKKEFVQVGLFRLTPEQHQGLVTILKHSGVMKFYQNNVFNMASKVGPHPSDITQQV